MSEVAMLAWNIAGAEAISANFELIEREHFFISLTEINKLLAHTAAKFNFTPEQTASAAAEFARLESAFKKLNLDMVTLRRAVRQKLGEGTYFLRRGDIHRSADSRKVFDRAKDLCRPGKTTGVAIMRALMENPGPIITQALEKNGSSPGAVLKEMEELSAPPEIRLAAQPKKQPDPRPPADMGALLKYGRDLSALAGKAQIFQCAGRLKEMERLLAVLWIGPKKIPVLIGPQGVGKTAMAETLAVRIFEGKAPGHLAGKTSVEIDTPALLRASPENNLQAKLGDIAAAAGAAAQEIMLYIPSAPQLLDAEKGACAARGGPQELRALLLSGAVRVILSADEAGFARMAADAELGPRLEKVPVAETGSQETLEILRAWKARLEKTHGVRINDKALPVVLSLGEAFRSPGAQPRKAIKILERACERAASAAKDPKGVAAVQYAELARKYGVTVSGEIDELRVAGAVAEAAGIPAGQVAEKLDNAVQSRLANLERIVKEGSVGQAEAADILVKRLTALVSGTITRPSVPFIFLFLGPEGAGKDELARQAAAGMFGSESEFVSYDMSQYSREEGVKKLFGNQYSAGILVDFLSRKPLSVVLFENVDKTPPIFFEEFCRFVRRNDITGDNGKRIDISLPLFILSSSLFSQAQLDQKKLPDAAEREVAKRFRGQLPRSFQEIITEIIVFKPLTEQIAARILLGWIEQARAMVRERCGADMRIGRDVERLLMEKGFSKSFGLRHLRVAYDEYFFSAVQTALNSREMFCSPLWNMTVADGRVTASPRQQDKPPYSTNPTG